MVIKTVQMGIPILVSRSGFTAWGVELARQAGLTLIGRAQGQALRGAGRGASGSTSTLTPGEAPDEPASHRRKGGRDDDGDDGGPQPGGRAES